MTKQSVQCNPLIFASIAAYVDALLTHLLKSQDKQLTVSLTPINETFQPSWGLCVYA